MPKPPPACNVISHSYFEMRLLPPIVVYYSYYCYPDIGPAILHFASIACCSRCAEYLPCYFFHSFLCRLPLQSIWNDLLLAACGLQSTAALGEGVNCKVFPVMRGDIVGGGREAQGCWMWMKCVHCVVLLCLKFRCISESVGPLLDFHLPDRSY